MEEIVAGRAEDPTRYTCFDSVPHPDSNLYVDSNASFERHSTIDVAIRSAEPKSFLASPLYLVHHPTPEGHLI